MRPAGRTNETSPRIVRCEGLLFLKAAPSYFPTVKTAVSSPLKSLASVFGMGTGVSSSLKAQPDRVWLGASLTTEYVILKDQKQEVFRGSLDFARENFFSILDLIK